MTIRWPPLAPSSDLLAGDANGPPAPTPTPPVEVGAVVAGKYRIDAVIGFGGMGIVCAATHLELATPIAIKFVRPELGADERAVARFLTEARAAAQLQSQFACRVMDCGRLPGGSPYIVMEYLVGQDLRSLVSARGPLGVEQAISFALQACEALAEAHVKHIVHRDVKPENLFVAEGPGGAQILKVLDFGISKQLSPLATQRSLTDSQESVGSPFHMSPEQMIDPANVDSRSDIWSLGVVLYEVLTGQMPFTGESGPQLCANVMTTEPLTPHAHRVELPDGLVQIILRCLDKDRERRFRDVGELSLALSEFGGPGAALAAARVQQIFGREGLELPEAPAVVTGDLFADAHAEALDSIPGVPRRGLGRRVGVALLLLLGTAFSAYTFRHELMRSKPAGDVLPPVSDPRPLPAALPPPAPPTSPPAPTPAPTQALRAATDAAPQPSFSARPKAKPAAPPVTHAPPVNRPAPHRLEPSPGPASTAESEDVPATPPTTEPPLNDSHAGAVYPTPPPVPELPPPDPPE
jgi:eukaryotic-like serine/threonine-protein kinase